MVVLPGVGEVERHGAGHGLTTEQRQVRLAYLPLDATGPGPPARASQDPQHPHEQRTSGGGLSQSPSPSGRPGTV